MDLIDATAAALPQSVGLGAGVGVALAVGTMLVLARGRMGLPSALGLALLVAAWQPLNQSIEGQVLWTVTPTHGLTTADLLAAPALALLATFLLRLVRRPARVGLAH